MPQCPMKLTAKLPSRADFSATRHPLTLSRPRPPYASGISTPSSPSSPALRKRTRPPRAARTGVLASVAIVISSRGGAAVQPIDHVLELLLHHPALDLERRRQLARFQRELSREQSDLLDLLELREVG